MSRTVEQRLNTLESLVKSLKATFPVAGSLVQFTVNKSQVFGVTLPANVTTIVKVKFTPDKNLGQHNLITLAAETTGLKWPCSYYVSPQNGDGTLMLVAMLPGALLETTTVELQVTALGTTAGTFTRIS